MRFRAALSKLARLPGSWMANKWLLLSAIVVLLGGAAAGALFMLRESGPEPYPPLAADAGRAVPAGSPSETAGGDRSPGTTGPAATPAVGCPPTKIGRAS